MTAIHSSMTDKGTTVTQTITMMGGYKKTIRGIKTDSFMQGEFTHFETLDGRTILVRTENVLFIEAIKE